MKGSLTMEKFYASTLKQCAFPEERGKAHTTVYWLAPNGVGDVTVVEKRSGCKLSATTFGCGCSKKNVPIVDIGKYLEEKYAAGLFKKLVLAGAQQDVQHLRHFLPQTMAPLITTEIIETDE